jgi:hypothetical protein
LAALLLAENILSNVSLRPFLPITISSFRTVYKMIDADQYYTDYLYRKIPASNGAEIG